MELLEIANCHCVRSIVAQLRHRNLDLTSRVRVKLRKFLERYQIVLTQAAMRDVLFINFPRDSELRMDCLHSDAFIRWQSLAICIRQRTHRTSNQHIHVLLRR